MKTTITAISLALGSFIAAAQGIPTLTKGTAITAEFSPKVSVNWSDEKTWTEYRPVEYKWTQTQEGLEMIDGTAVAVLINPKTYLQTIVPPGTTQLPQTLAENSTREGSDLNNGAKWKVEKTIVSPPASWCSDTKYKVESEFEVGPQEPYTLTIDGKETTIQVTPVVERGYWTKCYSGKRFTRLLVSKDLGAVVSIEHIGYTPRKEVHESSFRLNVKTIKRQI